MLKKIKSFFNGLFEPQVCVDRSAFNCEVFINIYTSELIVVNSIGEIELTSTITIGDFSSGNMKGIDRNDYEYLGPL